MYVASMRYRERSGKVGRLTKVMKEEKVLKGVEEKEGRPEE